MPKLKICFVSPHLYPILDPDAGVEFAGGAEVQQTLIMEGLQKLGYQTSAITLDYGQEDGCIVSSIQVFKSFKPDAGIRGLRFFYPRLYEIWQALHRADADIYYQRAAGMLTGVVAMFCAYHKKPFIFAGASDKDFIKGIPILPFFRDKLLYKWGLRHADQVVVQNEQQKKCLKDNFGLNGILIHNVGKNSNHRARWDDGRAAWVGTICPWKEPLRFIELASKTPGFQFLMMGGPGPNSDEQALWRSVCDEAANLENLTLAGHIPYNEMDVALKTVSVLLNTSDHEGFPNTFLEAWVRGIPTVSFVTVESGDHRPTPGIIATDMNEMHRVVRKLMTDKETWQKESSRCRKLFEQYFTFSDVADDYRELFDGLVNRSNIACSRETGIS